jgi:AcrR family transcriptional regulator
MNAGVRGRPRDPRVDESLTEHLVGLLAERGPDGFSVDELAARSGVGKAAIYRRYRSREELVEAGFAAVNDAMPDVGDLPVREALVRLLQWVSGAHAGGMTPTWLLTMKQMPQVKQLYMAKVVAPRRDALREVLQRGIAEGVIHPGIDVDTALACLSGPAILVGMHRASDYQAGSVSIDDVVDVVLNGLLTPGARATGS